MKWLTVNWQLKMVALFLATALWFYTSGQARISRSFTVKIPDTAVQGLGNKYSIIAVTPSEFTVEINGPAAALNALHGDVLTPTLEIKGKALEEGHQRFPITNAVLGLEPDLRIQGVNPVSIEDISVTFDRVVSAELFVDPPALVDVPEGLDPAISLEQGAATVSGPEGTVKALAADKRLSFFPISLAGANTQATKPEVRRFRLKPIAEGVRVSEVYANVSLKPIEGVKSQLSVPVLLLAPPEFLAKYRVELSQQQVVMTVHGPQNLLATLQPEQLNAYINLRIVPDLNQAREMPVVVVGPSWLTAEPTTVRVTVSLAPIAAAPVPAEGQ